VEHPCPWEVCWVSRPLFGSKAAGNLGLHPDSVG
jgi:hypothetical protein